MFSVGKARGINWLQSPLFGIQWDKNSLRRKSKDTVNLKTGRFDNIDSGTYSFVYYLAYTADDDS